MKEVLTEQLLDELLSKPNIQEALKNENLNNKNLTDYLNELLNSVWQITNLFAIIPLKLIIIYVNINKYVIINAGYIRDIEKYPAFYWRTYVLQGKK